jgi:uncharacterized repeat protein (TIGR01451 family)
VNGNNTIAVEVHNQTNTSTANIRDMLFDLQLQGNYEGTTFNSTTADLNLPSCSHVLFAGLYWGADQGTTGTDSSWFAFADAEKTMKLKLPGSSTYQVITSTQSNQHSLAWSTAGFNHTGYLCFADITSLLNATSPNGTYTGANVLGPLGIANGCGGWTIVVAYSNPSLQPRNLTIFDGAVVINLGDPPVDVNISGFLTPPSGTVSCELGAVVYDGDRSSQDAFLFKQQGAGAFYNLATTTVPFNGASDAWNSKIAYKNSLVTTRNPAYSNTLGYDASIFDLPNTGNAQLGNSKTSATIEFSSPSENYFVHCLSTSISQYNPAYSFDKAATDLNGGSLQPGDSIRYVITYNNLGNDASTGTVITDNIPFGTTFIRGSLKISGVAKTDATGDDQANFDNTNNRVQFRIGTGATSAAGGTINSGSTSTVQFDVIVGSTCQIVGCTAGSVSNSARIDYTGLSSGNVLYDSSGVNTSGCIVKGPTTSGFSGNCYNPTDTLIANICPATTIFLPYRKYAGYQFYSAKPFTSGNLYDPAVAVSATHTYWAYFDNGAGCSDTIRIDVFITACPDIDDDNDGIPDYVEINLSLALGDHDSDGIPNWNDINYPGYVDNNADGFNDNFDPSADSNNNGIPNFCDPTFPGYVDTNADGVNDNMDKDLDGVPNHLDLDSDNDGIPDTVESFGVDANGDGRIDNYTDTDNDGLSQNVDGSAGGVTGSGVGLGAIDTDGDGVANYLDLDSDNDGIPDIVEVYGTDTDNSGRVDTNTDTDGDGYYDIVDADTDNNGVIDNSGGALLKTSSDANGDGRADSWPNKNMEADSRPNPYDLDSDNDGITDVKEAQFTDADWNGKVDGAVNSNGWNTAIASQGSLTLPNTDGTGPVNPYDIDSDDDGIPDNVEGLTTSGYTLPGTTDTDNDGIINTYDNLVGFGGDGIHPVDTDGDTVPDYLDSDTDGDGLIDRVEGNDYNLNGKADDNVTLTGLDTDGDGLDNRFDANNSSVEATSAYMGNGGSISGDPTPGSNTMVQHTAIANSLGCPTERDWRCVFYVLKCTLLNFSANLHEQNVQLNWTVYCEQEADHFVVMRSVDGLHFTDIATVTARPGINAAEMYQSSDNISGIQSDIIYYRLRTEFPNGKSSLTNIILVRTNGGRSTSLEVTPNPARDHLQVTVNSPNAALATLTVMDASGKMLYKGSQLLQSGNNSFTYNGIVDLPPGIYYLRLNTSQSVWTSRFSVIK